MMRRVSRAWRIVLHPRLLRRDGVQHANAINAMIGHVLVEEIILLVVRRLDGFGAVEERRCPLARVAADETVEVFETQARGPEVERPGLTGVPVWNVVVLAIPGGVETVLLENFGERPRAVRLQAVVAGE